MFKIVHKYTLFSESIVSEIYFELGSISKNRSLNFGGSTVIVIKTISSSISSCKTDQIHDKNLCLIK